MNKLILQKLSTKVLYIPYDPSARGGARPAHAIKKRHEKGSRGRPSRAGAFSPRPTGAREPLLACPERPSKLGGAKAVMNRPFRGAAFNKRCHHG